MALWNQSCYSASFTSLTGIAHNFRQSCTRASNQRSHSRKEWHFQHKPLCAKRPTRVTVEDGNHHRHVRTSDAGRHVPACMRNQGRTSKTEVLEAKMYTENTVVSLSQEINLTKDSGRGGGCSQSKQSCRIATRRQISTCQGLFAVNRSGRSRTYQYQGLVHPLQ